MAHTVISIKLSKVMRRGPNRARTAPKSLGLSPPDILFLIEATNIW